MPTFCRPVLLSVLVTTWVTTSGCRCDEDRPYTPFKVATELPGDGAQAAQEPSEPPKEQFMTRGEVRAAGAPKRWRVFGHELNAPNGTRFDSAVEYGRRPSGSPDEPASGAIVAWVTGANAAGRGRAGAWLFDDAGQPAKHLAPLPEFLPRGSDCHPTATLEATGPESVTVDVKVQCESRLLPGTPTEAILILHPEASEPAALTLAVLDAAPGEKLSLEPNTEDQDGDGREDLEVAVTLTAPSGHAARARFRWLNRPAGTSRQAEFPRSELQERARTVAGWARRSQDAPKALAEIDALRRLGFAICKESRTPKVLDGGGSGLACGELGSLYSSLAASAVHAQLLSEHPLRALGEYQRTGWHFGAPSDQDSRAMQQTLLEAIRHGEVSASITRRAPTSVDEPYPVGPPLRFDPTGQLWAIDASGTVRPLGDPRAEGAGGASPGPRSWSRRPRGPGGISLAGALPSCDRSEVQLSFMRRDGSLASPVPIDMLAPRPGACGTLMGQPLLAVPLDWLRGQLLVVVEGQPVMSTGPLQAPSDPMAWMTKLGLAVWDGDNVELWTGVEADGSHCAVSNDRSQAACVLPKGRAAIYERPEF